MHRTPQTRTATPSRRRLARALSPVFEALELRQLLSGTAPQAVDDQYLLAEDAVLNVEAVDGVLANDTDPEADPLTAAVLSTTTHGTLELNPDGSFTYTPNAEYFGPDSFTYRLSDGTDVSDATVLITVTAVDDAPLARDDSFDTDEEAPLAGNVLDNDVDAENQILTATLVQGPSHGALLFNPDGSFSYTPDANYNGADSFTYMASDGANDSNVATVNITIAPVNDAPAADNDSAITDEGLTASGNVLTNDSDIDADALIAELVAGPAHGTLELNPDGSWLYSPEAGYTGFDSFTYQANDGTATSNIATVQIQIRPAPVADNDSANTLEDTPVSGNVLTNDAALEGDVMSPVLVAGPAHGALELNPDGSFTYTPNPDFNGADSFTYRTSNGRVLSEMATVAITIDPVNDAPLAADDSGSTDQDLPLSGNVLDNDSDVDNDPLTVTLVDGPSHGAVELNADGSFTYTPEPGYIGPDAFTYQSSDGQLQSNLATFSITVLPPNHLPVANDDALATDEDTPLAGNVQDNDTDEDGEALQASLVQAPSHGQLVLNADGSFTYTPDADYNGADAFTYRLFDGRGFSEVATVSLTINSVNDAPVANDDHYTTEEDEPIVLVAPSVMLNDTDADGDELSAIVVDQPSHGTITLTANGYLAYVPEANYFGTDSFTYRLSDGTAESNLATVNITITPVNDGPLAGNDTVQATEDTPLVVEPQAILANDSDVEADAFIATLVEGPSHGSLLFNPDGSFTYTPAANYNGTDSFTYRLSDGSDSGNVATVNLNIAAVNDGPAAVNDQYAAVINTPLVIGGTGVLGNDTDVDGDALTAVIEDQPLKGSVQLNADGSFTYTPEPGFVGIDTFTYRPHDGQVSGELATVTINVVQPNRAPIASKLSLVRAPGASLNINVLGQASDPDGHALAVSIASAPARGTATVNPNGTIRYVPRAGSLEADRFTYRLSDGHGGFSTAQVNIAVRGAGLVSNAGRKDLIVLGTAANDNIRLLATKSRAVKVMLNGVSQGAFAPTGRIIVKGLEGNDIITAAGLDRAVELHGGNGHDRLTGSAKPSRLFGGAGNDTLQGGTAKDLLDGGTGHDLLRR